jgi:hypothetical protein
MKILTLQVSPSNKAKCLEYLPPVDASILRVRFLSQTSVHSSSRFLLHYSTVPLDPKASCLGLPRSDAWHHVSAVIDVSDPVYARLSLYINGSLVASSSGPLKSPSNLAISGDMGLTIGRPDTTRAPPWMGGMLSNEPQAYLLWIHRGEDSFWAGGLDEIRIWNRSLTDAEISAGFNSSCARSAGPATVAGNLTGPLVCFGFEDVWDGGTAAGFRDTGVVEGAQMVPVVGDRHTAWCETRGDHGQLMSQYSSGSRTANENGQSWGFCTNKPQVPGLGFNYSESALLQFRMKHVTMLPQIPGCGEAAVIFSSNRARK